jgi:DNA-binding transcriptional ArsR family regulator
MSRRGSGVAGGRHQVDAVFSALSDPTRREVIRRLSQEGPTTATELAGRLPVTRQAVSKHLRALEEAGLVASTAEGRSRRYRLTPGPLADAMGWMADVGAGWDERLEALRQHLADGRRPRLV